jgi:hypothetical protein
MYPITILAASKVKSLLTENGSLAQQLQALLGVDDAEVPTITPSQVVLSSAGPDIGDKDVELTYPRVCLYSAGLKNTKTEKFRALSGTLSMIADVWASANLVSDSDRWIHYYVTAVASVLSANTGDWGNGMFFPGVYDVQFQTPKSGGLGYVQSARITFQLIVSQS